MLKAMQDLLLSDLQISEERIKKSLQDINTKTKKKWIRVKRNQKPCC
jgi:hypothetical protein